MNDRIPANDDLFDVTIQSTFTVGNENVLVKAAETGYILRALEGELSVRTAAAGAVSTITFKRGTAALRQFNTNDGQQVQLWDRARGWFETTVDTEDLNVNAGGAGTTLSGFVKVQRIPT